MTWNFQTVYQQKPTLRNRESDRAATLRNNHAEHGFEAGRIHVQETFEKLPTLTSNPELLGGVLHRPIAGRASIVFIRHHGFLTPRALLFDGSTGIDERIAEHNGLICRVISGEKSDTYEVAQFLNSAEYAGPTEVTTVGKPHSCRMIVLGLVSDLKPLRREPNGKREYCRANDDGRSHD